MAEERDSSILDNLKDNLKQLLSDRDFITFLAYLAIVIISTYYSMDIIARSWRTGIMEQSASTIRTISQSGISFLTNLTIGFFIGSIVLIFFDRKKRIQASILTVGIIIIIWYMTSTFHIDWNVYILLGFIFGLLAGRGFKKTADYRQATKNISIISVCYIIISYLNIYISQNQFTGEFFKDSMIILLFSGFFGTVMNYKGKGKRIFVLGPGHSGKTVFMVGCYKIALDRAESPTRPNRNLREAFNQLHKTRPKNESQNISSRQLEYWLRFTEDVKDYEFIYEIGRLFPKDVLFRTIDYPGAFLGNLPDNMYKKIYKDTDESTKTYIKIANEIIAADKLIFILDSERYPVFDYISYYIDIINILREKRKAFESYIVVTKGDIFMEEFKKRNYDEFKEFIEKKLSKNDYIKMLFTETSRSLYPVFCDTEKDEHGVLKPLRNEDGNIFIFGFEEFMDILME